jgi:hypothetical protein
MNFDTWWNSFKDRAAMEPYRTLCWAVWGASRDAALEDAAKVCDRWHDSLASEPEMLEIAEEIRSLK